MLHCAYFDLIYVLIPALLLIVAYRLKFYKSPTYNYALTQTLIQQKFGLSTRYKKVLWLLRFLVLCGLLFLILRPQWADERSKINVEGIDIVLAIDVSGSMELFDDTNDRRSRITVAKSEAIRFIEKRTDDPIGVVIFGREALSRCPLTLDKQVLKEIVGGLEIGVVNPSGTWLGTGLATAINRLRNSKAKSKIVVLLTDGEPTPPEQVDPDVAITMAQKFGIKIYTIGVGGAQGGYGIHPWFKQVVQIPTPLNETLLKKIAEKTGGMFFRATNPKEMRTVYDTIDRLEKTEIQTNIFHRYYEAFLNFIWIVLLLFGLELVLRLVIWRGVW